MTCVPRWMPLIAQVAAVVIWATTFVVSSNVLDDVSPALLTVSRFALAALFLLPFSLARRGLFRALANPKAVLLGLLGVACYYGFQNAGLLFTTAGSAALLQGVIPVSATVLAVIFLKERPKFGSIAGVIISTFGVVIAAGTGAVLNIGSLLIFVGAVAYAGYTVILRGLEAPSQAHSAQSMSDPVIVATATAIWGLVLLLPWLLVEIVTRQTRIEASGETVASLLYLGLVASGLTLLLWTFGARRLPATTSGLLVNVIPALGYGFAVVIGEAWTWGKTVGALLVLIGAGLGVAFGRGTNGAKAAADGRLSESAGCDLERER